MPVDQERTRLTFRRLDRELTKLVAKPAPEHVHRFRTHGRRLEALLDELIAEPNRNQKKLLRLLARLRKKAGRVRDLDVEISSLRNLKVPQEPGHKSQLLRTLSEDRAKREKKLAGAFNKETVRELRKRLRRAASETEIPEGTEPLTQALQLLAQLGRGHAPLTEESLHQHRIVGKRARYLAELAGKNAEAESVVEQLKRMQDVIGDWHDWLKLSQKAESLFGGVQDSALVAALRNVTRAKFRQALSAVTETRAALSAKRPTVSDARSSHSRAAGEVKATAAVA
jgi:CHAD domain-containing protein